jgi:hypothetical protein
MGCCSDSDPRQDRSSNRAPASCFERTKSRARQEQPRSPSTSLRKRSRAPNHRQDALRCGKPFSRDGEDVLRQDGKVRQLAGRQPALLCVFALGVRRSEGVAASTCSRVIASAGLFALVIANIVFRSGFGGPSEPGATGTPAAIRLLIMVILPARAPNCAHAVDD